MAAIQLTNEMVEIVDDDLFIHEFVENDQAVLQVARNASDIEVGVHLLLQAGARAVLSAGGRLDELTVARAFTQVADHLDSTLNHTVVQLSALTDGLIDEENGAVGRLLAETRDDLGRRLDALFDPASKESALSLFEEAFSVAATRQQQQLRSTLNPDDDDSPLGRWRTQMSREIRDSVAAITKQLTDMATTLAVRQAQAEERQRGTAKGVEYEVLVGDVLGDVACLHGDVVEAVGTTVGSEGSKTGDLVITINPEDTGGLAARVAVEVKNRQLPLRRTLEELDRAMANRDAGAGIVIFANASQAPVPPFAVFDDRIIVVLDEEDPNVQALEVGLLASRWIARRKLTVELETVDTETIEGLLADTKVALERSTSIRRCHTTARKQIDQARVELDALVSEVDDALQCLRRALRR